MHYGRCACGVQITFRLHAENSQHCWPTMLGVVASVCTCLKVGYRFQTLRNSSQQHATTCNRVCKRTQHVTSNNVASVSEGLKVKIDSNVDDK